MVLYQVKDKKIHNRSRWSQGMKGKRTCPAFFGFIKKVYHVESIGVLLPERFQLLAEENVFLGNI
jgi:hypothetical protein